LTKKGGQIFATGRQKSLLHGTAIGGDANQGRLYSGKREGGEHTSDLALRALSKEK